MAVFCVKTLGEEEESCTKIKYDVKEVKLSSSCEPISWIAGGLASDIEASKQCGYQQEIDQHSLDCIELFNHEYLKCVNVNYECRANHMNHLLSRISTFLEKHLYDGYVLLTVQYDIDGESYFEEIICKEDRVGMYCSEIRENCISRKVVYINTREIQAWDSDEDED